MLIKGDTLTIYTTGYAGKNAIDLKVLAERLGATVVDIRLVPASRFRKEWRGSELGKLLGDRYVQVRELGNVNYRLGGPIKIDDLDTGIARLLEIGGTLILLCGCADAQTCHRRVVAREMETKGHQVIEVERWAE
jgi:uncharacterized protein (DUF488 family)